MCEACRKCCWRKFCSNRIFLAPSMNVARVLRPFWRWMVSSSEREARGCCWKKWFPKRQCGSLWIVLWYTQHWTRAHQHNDTLFAMDKEVGVVGLSPFIQAGQPATFRVIRPGYARNMKFLMLKYSHRPTDCCAMVMMHPSDRRNRELCARSYGRLDAGSLFLACWLIRSLTILCCSHRLDTYLPYCYWWRSWNINLRRHSSEMRRKSGYQ